MTGEACLGSYASGLQGRLPSRWTCHEQIGTAHPLRGLEASLIANDVVALLGYLYHPAVHVDWGAIPRLNFDTY